LAGADLTWQESLSRGRRYRLSAMVVDDPEDARRLVAAGEAVVLLVDEGAPPVSWVTAGPGRLAVLVGSTSDPASWVAAQAMAAELFGQL
jgi:hypothetical protein